MNHKPMPLPHYRHEALMRYAKMLGFGELHIKNDPQTNLQAIIAIHSTQRGPAIGGCRFYRYNASGPAVKDALRLACMMTLKAAVSDLPHGGAKSVIIQPKIITDREALFHSFGDFVHQMNGDYITAVDVGSTTEDMNYIATRTPYVIGATRLHKGEVDPSPHTAIGVFRGIEAAVHFKLNRDNLSDIHVAIQGAGRVGYFLAKKLHEAGAKISICDIKKEAVEQCAAEFNANPVSIDDIYDVDCDIFAPCAMGGVLNLETINRIKASIIAGSANNQLAHRKYGFLLAAKNILYAPDFVINAGGLINAAMIYDYNDIDIANKKIDQLYDTLYNLFERSQKEKIPTMLVAELMAREKLSVKKMGQPIDG